MLLLTAADALSQCRYCNSYEDFVNDKWQPLDTLYSKKHGNSYVFLWGVGGYKLTTGDKDKRMQASRVIPILEKAGIIEAEE